MSLCKTLFICTTLFQISVTQIKFLKNVPRLNTTSYIDYYFSCLNVGNTLHWIINGTLSEELLANVITTVQNGTSSKFKYITSLLSSLPMQNNQFNMTSMLIVSLQTRLQLNVVCFSEMGTYDITIRDSIEQGILNTTYNPTIRLDYVLSDAIIAKSENCQTSVFVCGLNHIFQEWEINKTQEYGFDIYNTVGTSRHRLSHERTILEELAIVIDNQPYSIVTALFLTHTSDVAVAVICKSGLNQLQLSTLINPPSGFSSIPASIITTNPTFGGM